MERSKKEKREEEQTESSDFMEKISKASTQDTTSNTRESIRANIKENQQSANEQPSSQQSSKPLNISTSSSSTYYSPSQTNTPINVSDLSYLHFIITAINKYYYPIHDVFTSPTDLEWIVKILRTDKYIGDFAKAILQVISKYNLKDSISFDQVKEYYMNNVTQKDLVLFSSKEYQEKIISFIQERINQNPNMISVFLDYKDWLDFIKWEYNLANSPVDFYIFCKALVDIFNLNDVSEWKKLRDSYLSGSNLNAIKDTSWFNLFIKLRNKGIPSSLILSELREFSKEFNEYIDHGGITSILFDRNLLSKINATNYNNLDYCAILYDISTNSQDYISRETECKNLVLQLKSNISEFMSKLLSTYDIKIISYLFKLNIAESDLSPNKINTIFVPDGVIKRTIDNILRTYNKYPIIIVILPLHLFNINVDKEKSNSNLDFISENGKIILIPNKLDLIKNELVSQLINASRMYFKTEVEIPLHTYLIYTDKGLKTLYEYYLMNSPSQNVPNVKTQTLPSPKVQSIQLNVDYSYLNKIVGLASIIPMGPTIIKYDEKKAGIEESISRIAVEIAKIKGYAVNPLRISTANMNQITTIGTSSGVFVISSDFCGSKDQDFDKLIRNAISDLTGNKFSIIIMPNCLYNMYQPLIAGMPVKTMEIDFTPKEIKTLSYLVSGLQLNQVGYDGLSRTRQIYEDMLRESWNWLRQNYIDLDIPGNNESDTHRELKAVTIRYLIESKNIDPNSLLVEVDIGGSKPDIYVISTGEIYDAKTSIEKLPNDELFELLNKYSWLANKIYAVMEPLPVLLDLDAVIGRIISARKRGIDLNVLIPVKENNKTMLIDLFEFLEKGKKFYDSLTP